MENKTISIKDVIGAVINDLKTISVPADLLENFGPPLSRSLANLKVCYQAIDAAEKKEAAKVSEEIPNSAPIMQLVEEELNDAEEDQLESPVQE